MSVYWYAMPVGLMDRREMLELSNSERCLLWRLLDVQAQNGGFVPYTADLLKKRFGLSAPIGRLCRMMDHLCVAWFRWDELAGGYWLREGMMPEVGAGSGAGVGRNGNGHAKEERNRLADQHARRLEYRSKNQPVDVSPDDSTTTQPADEHMSEADSSADVSPDDSTTVAKSPSDSPYIDIKREKTAAADQTRATADAPSGTGVQPEDSAAAVGDGFVVVVKELVHIGLNECDAKRLAQADLVECVRQLRLTDGIPADQFVKSRAAYLVRAIPGKFGPFTRDKGGSGGPPSESVNERVIRQAAERKAARAAGGVGP